MFEFNTSITNGSVNVGDDLDSVAEVTHLFGMTAERVKGDIHYYISRRDFELGYVAVQPLAAATTVNEITKYKR